MAASDDLIWQIINKNFCSFQARVADNARQFCRNEHNVTGLCDRRSCPLANGRYATIKEEDGRAVLYIKTVERAHMPNRLWEKQVLPQNYTEAMQIIDQELAYWPKFMVLKNKQRLTKIHQLLIRMRKLAKEKNVPRMERVNQKDDRREVKREAKAVVAANLERSIEKELLDRLKQGTYGDIYNYPAQAYEKALDEVEEEYEDEEEEDVGPQRVQFVEGDFSSDGDEFDDEEDDDMEDFVPLAPPPPAAAAKRDPKRLRQDTTSSKFSAPPPRRGGPPKPPAAGKRSGPVIEVEYEGVVRQQQKH